MFTIIHFLRLCLFVWICYAEKYFICAYVFFVWICYAEKYFICAYVFLRAKPWKKNLGILR